MYNSIISNFIAVCKKARRIPAKIPRAKKRPRKKAGRRKTVKLKISENLVFSRDAA
ncbi:MAG: hypothetical protein VB021_07035 [Oscillospiraceae bacterium]|nr:hypothetical protein [Oscillospiraceae bacterium]